MPSDATDAGWLWDMLDSAQAVVEFVANRSQQDYVQDRMLRRELKLRKVGA